MGPTGSTVKLIFQRPESQDIFEAQDGACVVFVCVYMTVPIDGLQACRCVQSLHVLVHVRECGLCECARARVHMCVIWTTRTFVEHTYCKCK
jgi:hypothetical protein